MNELPKKILFYGIVIIVSIVTIYLAATTISANLNSYSHGLIHWHADVEIIICGEDTH